MSLLSPHKVNSNNFFEFSDIHVRNLDTIISAVLNAPGSWHDLHVAHPIYEQLHTKVPDNYNLVVDSAFPQGTSLIDGKIQAPIKGNTVVPSDPHELKKLLDFNCQLLSYHQTAEWGMHTMQGSFGRLRVPLDINHKMGQQALLETCV